MGIYIGFIEKKGLYVNFKPIAEIQEENIIILSETEQGNLLPDSEKRDINFYYQSRACLKNPLLSSF